MVIVLMADMITYVVGFTIVFLGVVLSVTLFSARATSSVTNSSDSVDA